METTRTVDGGYSASGSIDAPPAPTALILNGTSSAGKSALARALLRRSSASDTLLLSLDTFVNMLPPQLVGVGSEASEGFQFFRLGDVDGGEGISVRAGSRGDRVVKHMHRLAAAELRRGTNVIIDHLLISQTWSNDLAHLRRTGADVRFVLVTCALDVIEDRERSRGDRMSGLARGLQHVSSRMPWCDLELDTTHRSPDEAAETLVCSLFARTGWLGGRGAASEWGPRETERKVHPWSRRIRWTRCSWR